jgi:hypothetical protein
MPQPSAVNPNICRDCEQLTFDDSPVIAAQELGAQSPGTDLPAPERGKPEFHEFTRNP